MQVTISYSMPKLPIGKFGMMPDNIVSAESMASVTSFQQYFPILCFPYVVKLSML